MNDQILLDMHDKVQVKMVTQDGTDIWTDAKIIGFRERQVQVIYADGREQYLDKGMGHYRRPL